MTTKPVAPGANGHEPRPTGYRLGLALGLVLAQALGGGCGGDDDGDTGAPWALVFEELDGALMSVAGTSSSDVWAVGADVRDGSGALVLHYDGESWTRMETGEETDLWWVHAQADDAVWMGGAGGTILAYDGAEFTRMETPSSVTVYGIWGAAPDDLWAVGGEVENAPGFVWRYDGSAWTDVSDLLPFSAPSLVLFKVWGRGADDVWIVGENGVVLHWDGEAFALVDSDTDRQLFTVHGGADDDAPIVAVGGFADAVILESAGTDWHNVTPDPAPPELFGVFVVNAEQAYAVGFEGLVMERSDAAWKLLDTGVELFYPFHSVWVDPDGGVWAVGGDVQVPVPRHGMLLHRGEAISDEIED